MSGLFEYADNNLRARENQLHGARLAASALPGLVTPASTPPPGPPPFYPAQSTPGVSPAVPKAPQTFKIYQEPSSDDLVVELSHVSAEGAPLIESDLHELQAVADSILLMMRQLSQGPYDANDLRRMNHPYGLSNGQARRVPRYDSGRSLGHHRGVRGSVPNLSVINKNSGQLADSWEQSLELIANRATLRIRNTAKTQRGFSYPTALFTGTDKMQAHGPFRYAVERHQNAVDAAWRQMHQRAVLRQQAEAMLLDSLADSFALTKRGVS